MIHAKRRLRALPAIDAGDGMVVHQAVSAGQRRRGLAGLDVLPDGRALHLRPCRAVHTFGMHFALDLIWLDAAFRVVRVDRAVPPRRRRACLRARSVVELRAGEADRLLETGYTPQR